MKKTKQMSMIGKYHNHITQTNTRHHEEERQNTVTRHQEDS